MCYQILQAVLAKYSILILNLLPDIYTISALSQSFACVHQILIPEKTEERTQYDISHMNTAFLPKILGTKL